VALGPAFHGVAGAQASCIAAPVGSRNAVGHAERNQEIKAEVEKKSSS